MNHFLQAMSLLTTIPIKINFKIKNYSDYYKVMIYFPLVGLIMGIIYYAIAYLGKILEVDNLLLSVILEMSFIFLSGGMHYDGLADTVDGMLAGKDKEKTLDIMADSRVGAYGVIAIVANFILKVALFYSLLSKNAFDMIIFSPVIARFLQVRASHRKKYAKEDGMGNLYIAKIDSSTYLYSILWFYISFLIFMIISCNLWISLKELVYNIVYILLSVVVVDIFTDKIDKKLVGITGDTLGFIAEITQTTYLFVVALFSK